MNEMVKPVEELTGYLSPPPPVERQNCGLCGSPTHLVRELPTADVEPEEDVELLGTPADVELVCTDAVTVQGKRLLDYHNKPDAKYGFQAGTLHTLTLDICPKCFEGKLVPWFVSQGGTPRLDEDGFGEGTCHIKPEVS